MWVTFSWLLLHLHTGELPEAYRRADQARRLNYPDWHASWLATVLGKIETAQEIGGPLESLCAWVREERGEELAGDTLSTALDVAVEGRPLEAINAALTSLEEESPEIAATLGERLRQQYPDHPGVPSDTADTRPLDEGDGGPRSLGRANAQHAPREVVPDATLETNGDDSRQQQTP